LQYFGGGGGHAHSPTVVSLEEGCHLHLSVVPGHTFDWQSKGFENCEHTSAVGHWHQA